MADFAASAPEKGCARLVEWREIPGMENYEVSAHGDVRIKGGRRLKGFITPDGYVAFSLKRRKRPGAIHAHRLVAMAFIGPPPFEGAQVAHNDGSRLHNHFRNLRWASALENQRDRQEHGTASKGEANGRAVLSDDDVMTIRRTYQSIKAGLLKMKVSALADRYGIHHATLIDVATGKSWKHLPMPSLEEATADAGSAGHA